MQTTIPTTFAVAAAIRTADRNAPKFTVDQWSAIDFDVHETEKPSNCAMVTTKGGAATECTCNAFRSERVCWHLKLVDDHLAAEEAEALEAARSEMQGYWDEARA